MGGRGGGPSPSALGQARKKAAAQRSPVDVVTDAIFANLNDTRDMATLDDVRRTLAAQGWTREQQDAGLLQAMRSRQIVLFPLANQKIMTQAQRNAFIRVGNENKTAAAFVNPARGRLPDGR